MKKLGILTFVIFLASCKSEPSLCDCVEAGDAVNQISATLFDRKPTEETIDSLNQARQVKDSLCASFQTIDPIELQEKAKECESLEFSAEK